MLTQEDKLFLMNEFPVAWIKARREIYRSASANDAGSQVLVGTGSIVVRYRNDDLLFGTIVNQSSVNIWLRFKSPALMNSGILLRPLGGNIDFGLATNIPWTGDIYAIAESGAGNILNVTEVLFSV